MQSQRTCGGEGPTDIFPEPAADSDRWTLRYTPVAGRTTEGLKSELGGRTLCPRARPAEVRDRHYDHPWVSSNDLIDEKAERLGPLRSGGENKNVRHAGNRYQPLRLPSLSEIESDTSLAAVKELEQRRLDTTGRADPAGR
jgi:hypothetical protein